MLVPVSVHTRYIAVEAEKVVYFGRSLMDEALWTEPHGQSLMGKK